jgi:cation transport regulator ChaC
VGFFQSWALAVIYKTTCSDDEAGKYIYPYLHAGGMDKTRVVGYGSLMDPDSLSKTIKPREVRTVWIKGYKRIFNLKPSRMRRYHIGAKGINTAVLNVAAVDGAKMNAVMFEVDPDELDKLLIREQSYRTREVVAYDYETGEEIGKALMFVGNKMFRGQPVISEEYLPIQSYHEMVRDAAYRISERFGRDYDDSTLLADKRPLQDYMSSS